MLHNHFHRLHTKPSACIGDGVLVTWVVLTSMLFPYFNSQQVLQYKRRCGEMEEQMDAQRKETEYQKRTVSSYHRCSCSCICPNGCQRKH